MMVVTFKQDFDWCVANTIIAYKAGHHVAVTPDCAQTAVELGRAEYDHDSAYPEQEDFDAFASDLGEPFEDGE